MGKCSTLCRFPLRAVDAGGGNQRSGGPALGKRRAARQCRSVSALHRPVSIRPICDAGAAEDREHQQGLFVPGTLGDIRGSVGRRRQAQFLLRGTEAGTTGCHLEPCTLAGLRGQPRLHRTRHTAAQHIVRQVGICGRARDLGRSRELPADHRHLHGRPRSVLDGDPVFRSGSGRIRVRGRPDSGTDRSAWRPDRHPPRRLPARNTRPRCRLFLLPVRRGGRHAGVRPD